MRALVFHGPGKRSWEQVPDPEPRSPTDAVVRVDAVTICGTDLHILAGDVPEVEPGTILGHEAVGTVTRTGEAVQNLHNGDRVLVSCVSSCARCRFCRDGRYGQCLGGGGWILGHRINGTQAEAVRVPFADTSTYRLPDGVSDEAALMLADIVPTAYEVGASAGRVRPADTVAVVGAGPIGLAAILTTRLFSPSCVIAIDPVPARREAASRFGASLVLDATTDVEDRIMEAISAITDGLGVDVAIEAVGVPETFELCTRLIRPAGRIANIGVHGRSAALDLAALWDKDITITTGLVDTASTRTLLRMLAAGQLDTTPFVTHRYGLDEMQDAYDVFSRPEQSGALKIVLVAS